MTAETWTAVAAWVALLIATVGAGVALFQAAEARRLRFDQAQPHIVATMELDGASVDLVIKNYGPTAARDVRLDIQPRLRRTGSAAGTTEDVWVPQSIPTLAPGQEWRTWWDTAISRLDSTPLRGETLHTVTASFEGARKGKREVTASTLDWGAYAGILYTDVKTVHDAAKALEAIHTTMKGWTDTHGGLRVMNRDGESADERRRERHVEQREAHAKLAARVLPKAPPPSNS